MKSRVKWFNDEKGFGFIKYNESEDIFVHYSEIKIDGHKTLNTDDTVEFSLVNTDKGLQAKNVEILKENISLEV